MITLNRKVRFSHPDITYSVTNYTEYLFGAIGMKVNADIRVEVAWSTEDINMKFTASDDSIEIVGAGLTSFVADGFREGDTIAITGTVSNNMTTTITSISDHGTILFVAGALTNETVVANVFGETPIVSMEFLPNLVPNDSPLILFNLTDRETRPKYYADTITTDAANPTKMLVGTNSQGWVSPTDAATIYRLSFTNHIQTFVISHTFNIVPLYLAGQLTNLQDIKEPDLFRDNNNLKYVFTVEGKYTAYDPDPAHTTDGNVVFPKGQTGWFNEFINGRPAQWTKESILYYDYNASVASIAAGGGLVPLTGLSYCKKTLVYANIVTQVAAIESSFQLVIMYLPQNESDYINTDTNYKTNFIYERAVVTTASPASAGENTGDYHFIQTAAAGSLGGNRRQVLFTVEFSQTLIDLFNTKDAEDLNYLIFITAQGNTAGTSILNINQTSVIMDVNQYGCDKDDSTLFQVIDEVQFFEYPNCIGIGYSDFSVLPMDTVLTKTQFYVKQGTATELITLKNISANIVAVKQNDVEEFTLETFNINTSGYLPNCDNVQEIFFSQVRDFLLPSDDCRKEISLVRMPTLDIAGYSAYQLIYPFKVRWEEWVALQGANRCFTAPTQNWTIYGNQPGWSIKFSIKAEVEDASTGHTTAFEHITWGRIKDPCDIPYSTQITTSTVSLGADLEGVISKDEDTLIVATITGDFTGLTADQLYGILSLDAWGIGGVAYTQEIGTRTNVDSDGVWYGNGGLLKAILAKNSDTEIIIYAKINYLYLPTDTDQFIISARFGEYRQNGSSSGSTCLNEISIINFTCGDLEITEIVSVNSFKVTGQIDTAEQRDLFVQDLILTFVTATTWTVSGGSYNGQFVLSGTVGGNIIKAPAHPYTSDIVGDMLQGEITGTLNTSPTEISGIGGMQIGCTFFVS